MVVKSLLFILILLISSSNLFAQKKDCKVLMFDLSKKSERQESNIKKNINEGVIGIQNDVDFLEDMLLEKSQSKEDALSRLYDLLTLKKANNNLKNELLVFDQLNEVLSDKESFELAADLINLSLDPQRIFTNIQRKYLLRELMIIDGDHFLGLLDNTNNLNDDINSFKILLRIDNFGGEEIRFLDGAPNLTFSSQSLFSPLFYDAQIISGDVVIDTSDLLLKSYLAVLGLIFDKRHDPYFIKRFEIVGEIFLRVFSLNAITSGNLEKYLYTLNTFSKALKFLLRRVPKEYAKDVLVKKVLMKFSSQNNLDQVTMNAIISIIDDSYNIRFPDVTSLSSENDVQNLLKSSP